MLVNGLEEFGDVSGCSHATVVVLAWRAENGAAKVPDLTRMSWWRVVRESYRSLDLVFETILLRELQKDCGDFVSTW